eukprot:199392_1
MDDPLIQESNQFNNKWFMLYHSLNHVSRSKDIALLLTIVSGTIYIDWILFTLMSVHSYHIILPKYLWFLFIPSIIAYIIVVSFIFITVFRNIWCRQDDGHLVYQCFKSIAWIGAFLWILLLAFSFCILSLFVPQLWYLLSIKNNVSRFILHNTDPEYTSSDYVQRILKFCIQTEDHKHETQIRRIIATNYYLLSKFNNTIATKMSLRLFKYMKQLHQQTKSLNGVTLTDMRAHIGYSKFQMWTWKRCLIIYSAVFAVQSAVIVMCLFELIGLVGCVVYIILQSSVYALCLQLGYFDYVAMHILPIGQNKKVPHRKQMLYSLPFKETFDSVSNMMSGIETIYKIMYGQNEEAECLKQTLNDVMHSNLIDIIVEYLWYPLPKCTNMDEYVVGFNALCGNESSPSGTVWMCNSDVIIYALPSTPVIYSCMV